MKNKKYLYLLFIGIILVCFSISLGFRVFRHANFKQFPRPRETNLNLIQPWMTIDYIGKAYGIPPPEIKNKLNLRIDNNRESVDRIAKNNNMTADNLIVLIKQLISQFQEAHTKPPLK